MRLILATFTLFVNGMFFPWDSCFFFVFCLWTGSPNQDAGESSDIDLDMENADPRESTPEEKIGNHHVWLSLNFLVISIESTSRNYLSLAAMISYQQIGWHLSSKCVAVLLRKFCHLTLYTFSALPALIELAIVNLKIMWMSFRCSGGWNRSHSLGAWKWWSILSFESYGFVWNRNMRWGSRWKVQREM